MHGLKAVLVAALLNRRKNYRCESGCRTSGEARISNFLLWQSAYAEYEFIDTLWPEFKREEFERLCAGFGGRDRRFGGVKA